MEKVIQGIRSSLGNDSYNSYTEFSFPYFESLNTLVDYDTELDYAPVKNTTSIHHIRQNTKEKLVTRLSSNPTRFEKELRNIVLELYSESGTEKKGAAKEDIITESVQEPRGSAFSTQPFQVAPQCEATKEDIFKEGESIPEQSSEGLDSQGTQLSQVPFSSGAMSASPGHAVLSEESSRIQTLQQLRGNLQSLRFTDITDARGGSFSESDVVITPTFDDSGIHLEFVTSEHEISDNEPDEQADDDNGHKTGQDIHDYSGISSRASSMYSRSRVDEESGQLGNAGQADTSQYSKEIVFKGETTDVSKERKDTTSSNPIMNNELHKKLVRERTHMEGKLEALSLEYKNILEEKKGLQIRVQAMQARLQNVTRQERAIANGRDDEESQNLKALNENKVHFEKQVEQLKRFLHDRDLNLNNTKEQLKLSQENIQKLEEKISKFQGDISSKDEAIISLEGEMEKLQKSLAHAQSQREDVIREGQALNAEVSSLVKAKTWYQKQLEMAKEARVKLQLEVTEYESAIASQNSVVENLKSENARTNQELVETQQKTLEEKARILKHLETVEEDMLNQDAAFKQLQVDKQSIERELGAKIHELEAENTRLERLIGSAKTLASEVEMLRKDVEMKEHGMKGLQMEQEECAQQLKVARNVNEVSEKKVAAMKAKLDLKVKELQESSNKQRVSKGRIQKLEEEKGELLLQIKDTEDEKAAFDGAVQMLRLELEKVERRFKFMKQELVTKTKKLEMITTQKDGLVKELGTLGDEMEGQVTVLEELRTTVRDRSGTIEVLRADKARLEEELRVLGDRLRCAQISCAEAEKEKKELQEQLQEAESHVSHLEEQFHKSKLEKARLEGELETTTRTSAEQISASRLQAETLKQEMADMQRNLQHEMTRQRDEAITLEQQVEYLKSQAMKGSERYREELETLQRQLEKLTEERDTTQKNLKTSQDSNETNLREIKERHEEQIQRLKTNMASLQALKASAERKLVELEDQKQLSISAHKQKIARLEEDARTIKGKFEAQRKEMERMSLLAIELEREKGRLAGIMTSQKALREHCAKMDESIAKKESALVDLQGQLEAAKKEKDMELLSSQRQISQLQEELGEQRKALHELRANLMAEHKVSSMLRLKLAESEKEAENAIAKLSSSCLEAETLMKKYERSSKELQICKSSLEMALKDLRQDQMFSGRLQSELSVLRERDQVRDDHVCSLEWEVKQRNKEVDYMKEQLRLSEERQQVELENLRTSLQVAKSEGSFLRNELADARASKSTYQTKVFEMKDEVLTSRQETESVKHDLYQTRQQLRNLKAAILDASDLDTLKSLSDKKEYQPTVTSRHLSFTTNFNSPLSSLQECMSSLRTQISTLQSQMDQHTDAIHTSTSQWRTFGKSIKNLQNGSSGTLQSQTLLAEKDTH